TPVVVPRALWSTVNQHHEGILLARIEVIRLDDITVDLCAERAGPFSFFRGFEIRPAHQLRIHGSQCPQSTAIDVRRVNLSRRLHRTRSEDERPAVGCYANVRREDVAHHFRRISTGERNLKDRMLATIARGEVDGFSVR